ncbi:hypothetical protein J2Z40_001749 [Cytobacillus eiseniae]|uniref:Uncharacterized protein n=1 Tax=Cytobacillus eiseniae TaxID=762947 RepID=A0ABS4RH68_9BACI|nr:hypothetical protein [Cytobacillus eiseniae]MBP2241187.1 hypothetical protein [Cytobacillus eiseniae]
MKKTIKITQAKINNENELMLQSEDSFKISDLNPMEQMLVDSVNLSFIYVVDNKEDYTYIAMPISIWNELKKANETNAPVYISNQTERLLLPGLHEELSYLIENIKGNSNYGEEMVTKVESIFL